MKYDLSKKPTKGALRTLNAFTKGMFELLSKKSFEHISVNEICEYTNYPRATFYNYFDDKYDLLNYCWYCLSKQICFDEYKQINPLERLYVFFDRMYDLAQSHQNIIRRILKNNIDTGYMFVSFRTYMNNQIRITMNNNCPPSNNHKLPHGLMADYYSNTLILILEWCFFKGTLSKKQGHDYLKYIIKDV